MIEFGEIFGFVEAFGGETLVGWALRAGDAEPLRLTLYMDGISKFDFTCDIERLDVLTARADISERSLHGARLGFVVDIPNEYFDNIPHILELRSDKGTPVQLITVGGHWQESWSLTIARQKILGQVEATTMDAPIHGWVVTHDRITGEKRGHNRVQVSTNTHVIDEFNADLYRPDVAQIIGVEPNCGFLYIPDPYVVGTDVTDLHFTAVPQNVELRASPVQVHCLLPDGVTLPAAPVDTIRPVIRPEQPAVPLAPFVDIESDARIFTTRFPTDMLFGIGPTLTELRRAISTSLATEDIAKYQTDAERLIATEFDIKFYLSANPDVRDAGTDPIVHYTFTGFREGRVPARWFDPVYYLAANPDVRDANVNPFWHYLITGRKEGRFPSKFGGYRRDIIDKLVDPQDKTRGYFRPTSIPKLLTTNLSQSISRALAGATGLVLSVSHDCYIRATGGVQLFIADEQAGFAQRGIAYLNISPVYPDLVMAEPTARGMLQLVLNGTYLGITTHEDLAEVLEHSYPRQGEERIFIVHCLLGHQPERLITLQNAILAEHNYFWLHDFSSLCEGYNLLRNDVAFCSAPAPESVCCRVCIYGNRRATHLARVHHFFTEIPFVVVAPSRSAQEIWQKSTALPHITTIVHEHCFIEEDSMRVSMLEEGLRGTPENPVRIAFAGHPGAHKGWPLFLDLVNRTGHLDCYQYYHFTASEDAPIIPGVTRVITRTSPTDRSAMIDALALHAIDLVAMLAPWPETFSYVTFEALAAGADVITMADSGNVADVVLARQRGIVVQEDEALFDLFESLRIVQYVRLCYEQGIISGRLVHAGTTATMPVLAAAAE